MEKKVIKAGIWYTISNFLVNGIAIITTPIFARMLTKQEYGGYSNFSAVFSIMSVVVTLNMHSTLIRAQYDFEEKKKEYTSSIIILGMLVSVICLVISQVFFAFFYDLLKISREGLIIMFLALIFLPAINIFQTWQALNYSYIKSVIVSGLLTLGNVGFSLLFVMSFDDKLYGRILGSQIMTIVIGLVISIMYILKGKQFNFEYIRYALKICLPFIPHLLALTVLSLFDKIMITNICGEEYNAIYSIAVMCGLIITILISALNNSFSPWIGEKLHKGDLEEIRKNSFWYILIFVIVAIGVMLFAPEIIWVLGGEKYSEAKILIPPIILGGVCQLLYTLYVNIEQYEKKTIGMAIASCCAAGINFVLNAIMIPRFGYTAAAYTTFVSYLILLLMHYFLVRKMGLHKAYNTKYIVCILFSLVLFAMIAIWLYTKILIRYALCATYIIVLGLIFVRILKSGLLKKWK